MRLHCIKTLLTAIPANIPYPIPPRNNHVFLVPQPSCLILKRFGLSQNGLAGSQLAKNGIIFKTEAKI
uniref:Uncharacterized protein n=1 Tax=Anguilla anguilla TaxID=7936 RepID=A0A0E9UTN9_ANGAN